jgi:hypothetical protein
VVSLIPRTEQALVEAFHGRWSQVSPESTRLRFLLQDGLGDRDLRQKRTVDHARGLPMLVTSQSSP